MSIFNDNNMSNEEFDAIVDNTIIEIQDIIADRSDGDKILSLTNQSRLKDMATLYVTLKKLIRYNGVSIRYGIDDDALVGNITVLGHAIPVVCKGYPNTQIFADCINLASNFEVYPRTDGFVQMNFAFNDLLDKEERENA